MITLGLDAALYRPIARLRKSGPSSIRLRLRLRSKARHFSSTGTRRESLVEKPKFRILFCGSDEFSVASLRAVHEAKDLWSSIDVVVPPEREVGRGGKHKHQGGHKSVERYTPALRQFAEAHNLPTTSVPSTGIKTWTPPFPFTFPSPSHLLLTASFGHIIPLRLLNLFPADNRLNVHPSLLPRWRGAAPVQWTIASGDEATGVSVQRLVKYSLGVDAGDIVGVRRGIQVPSDATYNTFLPHLAEVGGQLLVDVLRNMQSGTATFTPQDQADITFAPKITLDTARVRWSEQSAEEIDRLHRGIHHQCPLWTTTQQSSAQLLSLRPVLSSELASELASISSNGEFTAGTGHLIKQGKDRRLFVLCASETWLEVTQLQMAGKKALGVKEWWNGLPKDVRDGAVVRFD